MIHSSRNMNSESRVPNPVQHGFTLLELMFTLVIFCLLLSATGFFFRKGIDHSALETAASVLKSDMLLVQRLSSAEGKNYLITFYTDRYTWSSEGIIMEERKLLKGVRIAKTTFTKKDPGKNAVIIYPSLAPSQGGTITVQSALGEKKYVIISYYFGRIRMSDTPP